MKSLWIDADDKHADTYKPMIKLFKGRQVNSLFWNGPEKISELGEYY